MESFRSESRQDSYWPGTGSWRPTAGSRVNPLVAGQWGGVESQGTVRTVGCWGERRHSGGWEMWIQSIYLPMSTEYVRILATSTATPMNTSWISVLSMVKKKKKNRQKLIKAFIFQICRLNLTWMSHRYLKLSVSKTKPIIFFTKHVTSYDYVRNQYYKLPGTHVRNLGIIIRPIISLPAYEPPFLILGYHHCVSFDGSQGYFLFLLPAFDFLVILHIRAYNILGISLKYNQMCS